MEAVTVSISNSFSEKQSPNCHILREKGDDCLYDWDYWRLSRLLYLET